MTDLIAETGDVVVAPAAVHTMFVEGPEKALKDRFW
jgi:hypothetical protein